MKYRIILGLLVVLLGLGGLWFYQQRQQAPGASSAPAVGNPDYRDLTIPTK